MKKKIFALCLISLLAVSFFTAASSAERKIGLPITLREANSANTLEITDFSVTKVENLQGQYMNRIYYTINHSYTAHSWELALHCNDASGTRFETVPLKLKERATSTNGQIDVPSATATVELASENEGDSYLYVRYVNMYSEDGKILAVTDLQVPIYNMVGWSLPVTVYAYENGMFSRATDIHPSKTEAYRQVGWYTEEEVGKAVTMYACENGKFSRTMRVPERLVSAYRQVGWYTYEDAENKQKTEAANNAIFNKIDEYKAAKRYNEIFVLIENEIGKYSGTATEARLLACRNEVMDIWREEINSPLAILNYETDKDRSGTPTATINFRNVSYKKITSFTVRFNCYNSQGRLEYTNYSTYSALDTDLETAKANGWVWTLGGAKNVKTIKDLYVVEVTFEDGTKWKA